MNENYTFLVLSDNDAEVLIRLTSIEAIQGHEAGTTLALDSGRTVVVKESVGYSMETIDGLVRELDQ